MEERISREDIVRLYNIEITFFDDLASSGLIQTEVINNTTYLHYDQLSAFERKFSDQNCILTFKP